MVTFVNGRLKTIQIPTGPTMPGGNCVYSIVVSVDGWWIVSGEWGSKVIVWDAAINS